MLLFPAVSLWPGSPLHLLLAAPLQVPCMADVVRVILWIFPPRTTCPWCSDLSGRIIISAALAEILFSACRPPRRRRRLPAHLSTAEKNRVSIKLIDRSKILTEYAIAFVCSPDPRYAEMHIIANIFMMINFHWLIWAMT